VGTIALQFSYRRVICVALSDSGDIMACGTADSTIKIFWLNPAKIKEMTGLTENQTSNLSSDGLKVQLYSQLL
jgi:WD40 repeat protein